MPLIPSVFIVDGETINLEANDCVLRSLVVYNKGSYPVLMFEKHGVPIGSINTDTWNGTGVSLYINGTRYFQGTVVSVAEEFGHIGYTLSYQALGMRHRGDLIPWTNEIDNLATSFFNLLVTDPLYNAAQAGRTVGQILQTTLKWATNTSNMSLYGLFYSSNTDSDLDALTIIPQKPIQIGGEKMLGAVEGFLSSYAPNTTLWVTPEGELRFLDLTAFTPLTLTLGVDLLEPPELTRETQSCFQAVVVRGAPWVQPVFLSLLNGGIVEDFTWGTFTTNAEAIAAWNSSDFSPGPGQGGASMTGSCVVSSTTNVIITATDNWFFPSDYWDQNLGRHGVIYLNDSTIPGTDSFVSRRIVANTAMVVGGTSTITVDIPLNFTTYTNFQVYGYTGDASNVWRQYAIVNSFIADHLANAFSYPVPFVSANGQAATMISIPAASVCYQGAETPVSFNYDTTTGTIIFTYPTALIYGQPPDGQKPDDIRCMLAVNSTYNTVRVPTSGWSGTSFTHDGMENTLTVSIPEWTDPLNAVNVTAYAADLLTSVQDTVISGKLSYLGLLEEVLTMGVAIQIAENYGAAPYTSTGFEDIALPVDAVQVHFMQGSGTIHETVMSVSNRRSHYTADEFLRPNRPMVLKNIDYGGPVIQGQYSGVGQATAGNTAQGAPGSQIVGGVGQNVAGGMGVDQVNSAVGNVQNKDGTISGVSHVAIPDAMPSVPVLDADQAQADINASSGGPGSAGHLRTPKEVQKAVRADRENAIKERARQKANKQAAHDTYINKPKGEHELHRQKAAKKKEATHEKHRIADDQKESRRRASERRRQQNDEASSGRAAKKSLDD
jgi:hypothetical protein